MLIIRFLKILFVLSVTCSAFSIEARAQADEFPAAIQPDSVCFKFSFSKGDSLIYQLTASDSIVLEGQPPLIKRRTESILLVCDSVGANGHFYMQQKLVGFASKEAARDTSTMMRLETPWLNRVAMFEIDSLGNRYSWHQDDTTRQAIGPGGAFEQNIIFPLQESCKRINESWIVTMQDDLPENGIPAPVRKHTTIFRALEPLDTLGERCNRFQMALTGQGLSIVGAEGKKIRTTAILTTFGMMEISTEKHVPVHFFVIAEAKLKIEMQTGQSTSGKQYGRMNYTLISYKSPTPQKTPLKTKVF